MQIKRRRVDQAMEARQKTMRNAENQLTIMLLLVTTLFLILLCPTYFRFIYLVFAKRDTPLEYAKSMLILQITAKLYATNSGINFFLYCISGKKFRDDLMETFRCSDISHCSLSGREDGSLSNVNRNYHFLCKKRLVVVLREYEHFVVIEYQADYPYEYFT